MTQQDIPIVTPPTTEYIRDYLLKFGEGSPSDIYRYYRDRSKSLKAEAEVEPDWFKKMIMLRDAKMYGRISYRSIVRLFYILRQLELIEFTRSEPAHGLNKNFYRIVPNRTKDIKGGVQFELYPDSKWGGARFEAAGKRSDLIRGRVPGLPFRHYRDPV